MRDFIKKCLYNFIHNKVVWASCVCNLILCLCMGYFYFDSGHLIAPLVYSVFFLLYCTIIFFIGEKSIPFMYMAFSVISIYNITFINCTIFIIMVGLSWYFPKWKYAFFIVYLLEVFLICFYNDRTVLHLLAHICFCVIYYLSAEALKKYIIRNAYIDISYNFKNLELTAKEELIIKQLAEGRLLKEVEGCSKNTKKKYIDSAMLRNNCKTRAELVAMYAIQNHITGPNQKDPVV